MYSKLGTLLVVITLTCGTNVASGNDDLGWGGWGVPYFDNTPPRMGYVYPNVPYTNSYGPPYYQGYGPPYVNYYVQPFAPVQAPLYNNYGNNSNYNASSVNGYYDEYYFR